MPGRRLGRILAGLAPAEPEVHGLVAPMPLHAAPLDAAGRPVLLLDQDRSRCNGALLRRGLAALARAAAPACHAATCYRPGSPPAR
jgi:predicted RNA polymerase sigma factor